MTHEPLDLRALTGATPDPDLLAWISGQSSTVRNDGLLLYGPQDVEERNRSFGVSEFMPGYLLIGDDSGGRGFLVEAKEGGTPNVFVCELGGLLQEYLVPIAPSLGAWQASGYPLPP